MIELNNLLDEQLTLFDQIKIALPDDNLWVNKGSLKLLEKAKILLRAVNTNTPNADYMALLGSDLQFSVTPEILLLANEQRSIETIRSINEGYLGLGIIDQIDQERLPERVRKIADLSLPVGANTIEGTLILPSDMSKFIDEGTDVTYKTLATRLKFASDLTRLEMKPSQFESSNRSRIIHRYR